jgi:3-methylcrotonyl-CoA carboxylase alpha subunit
MKRLVDGEEVEFSDLTVSVSHLSDRLLVHTPGGVFSALVIRKGDTAYVSYRGRQYRVERPGARRSTSGTNESGELRAPMPGTIVQVNVREGDAVEKGMTILVLEAMKTQQPFVAPFNGIVEKLPFGVGESVSEGSLLAFLLMSTDNVQRVSE